MDPWLIGPGEPLYEDAPECPVPVTDGDGQQWDLETLFRRPVPDPPAPEGGDADD